MRLVLFATNANPYLCALLKSALLHAVEVNIIGWNLRPAAGQAINQVISEMNARWACAEPRQSIVMGLDAFDTMFTPKPVSARSLRDHLAERGADFVWSAESNMFPAFSEFAPGFEESYPAGSPTRYKYLNYGGWVGTAAAACRVMQTCSQQMKNCTHCREAAQAGKTGWAWFDQHAAQYALVRLKGGARQVLDNRNEMFHSGWLDCSDFNTTSYRLRSSGVAPHVLHLNGDAKRFCGAAVFSEAWFVNRTTLPTWHITLSEGKLTRSVHVNDICPSILQPAVMAAELEGWYASTRAKAEKRMASTRHKPHRHTVKETLSAATVTCHKAPIRACAGSVMGAANGHFNCSDAKVRCSAAPWCAGIHHVYPWCHAMTCHHVEDRFGHCVELVRTSARPAQRAASPAGITPLTSNSTCFVNATTGEAAFAAPSFFVVGSAKAATTSLYSALTFNRTCVVAALDKELWTFRHWGNLDCPGKHCRGGIAVQREMLSLRNDSAASELGVTAVVERLYPLSYPKAFDACRKLSASATGKARVMDGCQCAHCMPITGEATPDYAFYPLAALRIAHHLPRARLLLTTRDPLDRALSSFNFHSARHASRLSPSQMAGHLSSVGQQIEKSWTEVRRCEILFDNVKRVDTQMVGAWGWITGTPVYASPGLVEGLVEESEQCYFPPRVSHLNVVGRAHYAAQLRLLLRLFPTEQLALVEFDAVVRANILPLYGFLGLPPPTEITMPHFNGPGHPVSKAHQNARLNESEFLSNRRHHAHVFGTLVADLCNLTRKPLGFLRVPDQPICYQGYGMQG